MELTVRMSELTTLWKLGLKMQFNLTFYLTAVYHQLHIYTQWKKAVLYTFEFGRGTSVLQKHVFMTYFPSSPFSGNGAKDASFSRLFAFKPTLSHSSLLAKTAIRRKWPCWHFCSTQGELEGGINCFYQLKDKGYWFVEYIISSFPFYLLWFIEKEKCMLSSALIN